MAKTYEVEKREAQTPERVERTRPVKVYAPRVDIHETREAITLAADMPGTDEKSVDLTLEQGVLTIRGEARVERPEGYTLAYAEYDMGHYERAFTLSDEIDQNAIQASVKNGVLRLTLPKAQPAPARKIVVKKD